MKMIFIMFLYEHFLYSHLQFFSGVVNDEHGDAPGNFIFEKEVSKENWVQMCSLLISVGKNVE